MPKLPHIAQVYISLQAIKPCFDQLNNGLPWQVLSTFDNGRVEGFLDMRTLKPVEMTEPSMARRIAQRLKHFHSAPVQLEGATAEPSEEDFPLMRKW